MNETITYAVELSPRAKDDMLKWKATGQLKAIKKVRALLDELRFHPTTGTGQVEQLRGNHDGLWSRRIDKKSRLVYTINDDTVTVLVISAYGHYDDK